MFFIKLTNVNKHISVIEHGGFDSISIQENLTTQNISEILRKFEAVRYRRLFLDVRHCNVTED